MSSVSEDKREPETLIDECEALLSSERTFLETDPDFERHPLVPEPGKQSSAQPAPGGTRCCSAWIRPVRPVHGISSAETAASCARMKAAVWSPARRRTARIR